MISHSYQNQGVFQCAAHKRLKEMVLLWCALAEKDNVF